MPTKARFFAELRAALENFDYQVAADLIARIQSAEAAGYELTTREEGLWNRLVRCVDQYLRAYRHVE
jgi:hypothetical protein